jgi:hypothetical protein
VVGTALLNARPGDWIWGRFAGLFRAESDPLEPTLYVDNRCQQLIVEVPSGSLGEQRPVCPAVDADMPYKDFEVTPVEILTGTPP